MMPAATLDFVPATPDRWGDLERLFGPRGACAGCWCMWWRIKRAEFEKRKGGANRSAFRKLVKAGRVPGLLAYRGGEPVGWIAVEPRERYASLERSRILARVDEEPVWSVTCFFVARSERGRGLATRLLREAVRHARREGARFVEGYPIALRKRRAPDLDLFTGTLGSFQQVGFREVERRSPSRPIVRKRLR